MKYVDLELNRTLIMQVYDGARGPLKLKVRRVLKPVIDELAVYFDELGKSMKDAGAEIQGERLMVPQVADTGTQEEIQASIDRHNAVQRVLDEMRDTDYEPEIKTQFTLEDLAEIDISNVQIDELIRIGLCRDDVVDEPAPSPIPDKKAG